MNIAYTYRVAGFLLHVRVPESLNMDQLLPSFAAFRCEPDEAEPYLFRFEAVTVPLPKGNVLRVLEDAESDLGHTRLLETADGYRVELHYAAGTPMHTLQANADFTLATACICWEDPYVSEALNSLLRIVYSQAVLSAGGISVHAAAVAWKQKAYLFMGKSGTGKSTHAALWLRCFPDSELLNDDNPTLRFVQGSVWAFGTPWSGKTPCYKNQCFPVAGIVRLQQAKENCFLMQENVEAFITLLPGCSVIRTQPMLYNALCDLLVSITNTTRVGQLQCLPDEAAARLCCAALSGEE